MFKFRHESQITIRDYELKERQAELAQAYEKRRKAEEAMQILEEQLAEGLVAVRSQMQEGQTVNVNHLIGFRRQEMFLRANQEKITEYIQEVDREIEFHHARVLKASQELKSVQKLKEKHYEVYQDEEKKAEAKFLDEIAGNKQERNRKTLVLCNP